MAPAHACDCTPNDQPISLNFCLLKHSIATYDPRGMLIKQRNSDCFFNGTTRKSLVVRILEDHNKKYMLKPGNQINRF